jgi:hypothetical protein
MASDVEGSVVLKSLAVVYLIVKSTLSERPCWLIDSLVGTTMHLNQVGGRSLRVAWCNDSREVDGILEVLEGPSSCSNGSTFPSSCVDDKMSN